MKASFSLRRIALTLAVLGVLSLFGPLSAAQAGSFQASGSFAFTSSSSGTLSGKATPYGPFSGSFSQHGGDRLQGTATFDFGGGSVTFSYDIRLDKASDQFQGTYSITGGTGNLAGASGSGRLTVDHGSTGSFTLSGTLSQ